MIRDDIWQVWRSAHRPVSVVFILVLVVIATPISTVEAVSFTASDVNVTSPNGKLQSLTVAPSGTVTYRGFDQRPSATIVTIQVLVDGTWESIGNQSVPVANLQGSVDFSFPQLDVIDRTSDGLTADEFAAQSPHQPTTTSVHVRVSVVFKGVKPNGDDLSITRRATFAVNVAQSSGPPGGGGPGGGPPGGGPPGRNG